MADSPSASKLSRPGDKRNVPSPGPNQREATAIASSSLPSKSNRNKRQRTRRKGGGGGNKGKNDDDNDSVKSEDDDDVASGTDDNKQRRQQQQHQQQTKKKQRADDERTNRPHTSSWTPPQWRQTDVPSFLDATATVSVATFASRRLPELKQLYVAAFGTSSAHGNDGDDGGGGGGAGSGLLATGRPELALQSGGGKRSTRHLRRRTTAVRSRKHRHRYPTGSGPQTKVNNNNNNNDHTNIDASTGPATTTAAHDVNQVADLEDNPEPNNDIGGEFKTRKAKRKKVNLLSHQHMQWLSTTTTLTEEEEKSEPNGQRDADNATTTTEGHGQASSLPSHPNTNPSTSTGISHPTQPSSSSSITNWLTTHLWHSKRFHMGKLWGWAIPLAHTNRGSRAVLRLSTTSSSSSTLSSSASSLYCMLRDISWERQPLVISVTRPGNDNTNSRTSNSDNDSRTNQMTLFLLQSLGRICPDLVSASGRDDGGDHQNTTVATFLSGTSMNEVVLYEVDQFPRNAIGPVWWRIVRPSVDVVCSDDQDEGNGRSENMTWKVEVRCHPSIRTQVSDCLTMLMEGMSSSLTSSSSIIPPPPLMLAWDKDDAAQCASRRTSQSPRIAFRLYGPSSTRVLHNIITDTMEAPGVIAMQPTPAGKSPLVWNQVVSYLQNIGEEGKDASPSLLHGSIVQITSASIRSKMGQSSSGGLILVYQCPRPLDCAANRGMSGWEIYCWDATLARELWIAMATTKVPANTNTIVSATSSACSCVIGLVDDSHLRLECEPPLPVFPRDYVDTKESESYWRTNDCVGGTEKMGAHHDTPEWQRVRQLYEGGWGRLPIGRSLGNGIVHKPLPSIEVYDLVPSVQMGDETSTGAAEIAEHRKVVTVRGVFGYPFLKAIRDCARFDADVPGGADDGSATTATRRRKRRASRPRNQIVCAPLLSKTERESFSATCQQLLASLTLPAVLLVHVRCLGKGSISAGMQIVSFAKDISEEDVDKPLGLGRVTTGSFSPSRGVCHGLGIVGAAVFLEYLARAVVASNSCGLRVRLANGKLSLQLLVSVVPNHGRPTTKDACLSLIFD